MALFLRVLCKSTWIHLTKIRVYCPCLCYYWLGGCSGCFCLVVWSERGSIRALYGIPGDKCEDCLLYYFCFPFALSQEYREIKVRTLNQTISGQQIKFPPQQGYPPQLGNPPKKVYLDQGNN